MSSTSSTGGGGPIDHDKRSDDDDGPLTRGRIAIIAGVALFGLLAVTGALPVQFGGLTGDDSGLDIADVEVTVSNPVSDTVTDTVEVDIGDLGTETEEVTVDAEATGTVTLGFEAEKVTREKGKAASTLPPMGPHKFYLLSA